MQSQGKMFEPVENRFDGISDEHITSRDPDEVSVSVSATFLYFKLNDIYTRYQSSSDCEFEQNQATIARQIFQ